MTLLVDRPSAQSLTVCAIAAGAFLGTWMADEADRQDLIDARKEH